jgi:hypothetical protein
MQKPKANVMQDMDGLEIELLSSCGMCGQRCTLVGAGVPSSVQELMMVQTKSWVTALCQTRWASGNFLIAQFKKEESGDKVAMMQKLFKFECKEALAKVKASKSLPESKPRTSEI